jgi:membrane associated rhomboid family serine protease
MTTPDQVPPAGQETPPACYRHPDRETWVSCVRCGRHACPDCLRSAAVGQQCVDCVHEGGRTVRRPSTVFGGQPSRTAVVTYTLIGLNVALFLVELARPSISYDWELLGYAPFTAGGPIQGVAAGQWYRLLTSAFLPPTGNLGFLDIAFNMWALFVVGPALEQLLGRGRFLTLYLLSALGGGVAYFLLAPSNAGALGASGAIYGLFGAWFVVSRRLQLDTRGILVLIGINLVLSFTISEIAWQDHIGGLITGVLVTAAFAYAPRKNRLLYQAAAAVAVFGVLVVITVLRSNHLTAPISQAAGF